MPRAANQMRRVFEERLVAYVAEIKSLLLEQGLELLEGYSHEDPEVASVQIELVAACQETREAREELQRVQAKYNWISMRILSTVSGHYGPIWTKFYRHNIELRIAGENAYKMKGRVLELQRKYRWAAHTTARTVHPVPVQPSRQEEIVRRFNEIYQTLFHDLIFDDEDTRLKQVMQRATAAQTEAQAKAKRTVAVVALFSGGSDLLEQRIQSLDIHGNDLDAQEKTELLASQQNNINSLDVLLREVKQALLKLTDSSRRAVDALEMQIERLKYSSLPAYAMDYKDPNNQLRQAEVDRLTATKKLIDEANRCEKPKESVLVDYSNRWSAKVDLAREELRQYREMLVSETIRRRHMNVCCSFTKYSAGLDI